MVRLVDSVLLVLSQHHPRDPRTKLAERRWQASHPTKCSGLPFHCKISCKQRWQTSAVHISDTHELHLGSHRSTTSAVFTADGFQNVTSMLESLEIIVLITQRKDSGRRQGQGSYFPLLTNPSLSAPTKIEELTAGSDEKKHSAAPPRIEPRILRNLVARSNHWATKPQRELRVNFRLSPSCQFFFHYEVTRIARVYKHAATNDNSLDLDPFNRKFALVGIIPNQPLSFSSDKDRRTDGRIRRSSVVRACD